MKRTLLIIFSVVVIATIILTPTVKRVVDKPSADLKACRDSLKAAQDIIGWYEVHAFETKK